MAQNGPTTEKSSGYEPEDFSFVRFCFGEDTGNDLSGRQQPFQSRCAGSVRWFQSSCGRAYSFDGVQIRAGLDEHGRCGVPQIVHTHLVKTGFRSEVFPALRDGVRRREHAVQLTDILHDAVLWGRRHARPEALSDVGHKVQRAAAWRFSAWASRQVSPRRRKCTARRL